MKNEFRLAYLNLAMTEVVKAERGLEGVRVTVTVQNMSDDPMDVLWHEGLFTPEEARRLVEYIRRRGVLNLNHWYWVPSMATPFRQLQMRPVAQLQKTPYVPTF